MLNKVDTLDPDLAGNPEGIYQSAEVQEMCGRASEACGVPANDVFPVKSYSREFDVDYRVRGFVMQSKRVAWNCKSRARMLISELTWFFLLASSCPASFICDWRH